MDTRDERSKTSDIDEAPVPDETPDLYFYERPDVADHVVHETMHRPDPGDLRELESGETVTALFSSPADAQRAVRDLQDEGFPQDAIGVLMQDQEIAEELVLNPVAYIAEGAAMGAVEGGLLGGALGLLVGAMVVPGVGPIVAGGALASALAAAGPTALAGIGLGAATGSVVGALTGKPIPEADEDRLGEGLAGGGVVLTVHAGDRAADAIAILIRNNGDTGSAHGNLNPLYHDQPAHVEHTAPEAEIMAERADNLEIDVDDAEDPDLADRPGSRTTG